MRRRVTTTQRQPLTIRSGASTPMPATTATATASWTPMATVYATSLKSQDVPMPLPVTTTRMLPKRFMQYAEVGYDCDGLLKRPTATASVTSSNWWVADDSACNYNADDRRRWFLTSLRTATIATAFA